MSKVITTIVIERKTHDRLKNHGVMGDSFDDVINRILDKIEGKPATVAPKL